jgi:hypothetical protein
LGLPGTPLTKSRETLNYGWGFLAVGSKNLYRTHMEIMLTVFAGSCSRRDTPHIGLGGFPVL